MKHRNLAIFIPHAGCPHRCSFCDQRQISGQATAPSPQKVKEMIEHCVNLPSHRPELTQIAFFGGSFTCIPREQMTEYLAITKPYIESGAFTGLRLSTRPDGISPEILSILKEYHVQAIELGAQSMSEEVLLQANRGHTPEDTVQAAKLIHEYGFDLGLQMLLGLPGDSKEIAYQTALKLAALNPKEMRLYPAVVFPGTTLHQQFLDGSYTPLTVEEALDWITPIAGYLQEQGIQLLKVGLHQADGAVAGAFHPAFGEMVRTALWNQKLKKQLPSEKGELLVYIQPEERSIAVGQKQKNLEYWKSQGYPLKFTYKDDPDAIKL